ncbi:craniofacial development protein 1-like [Camellia sinensis]|uniref:craniofacial development protein 1-like n=1 Tax=Camellia sinensis TaxID=4442 RepID=UPI001035C475|nr:craniofacial development protein 1-like [Camellia sinensis]
MLSSMASSSNRFNSSGNGERTDGISMEPADEGAPVSSLQAQPEETERKARVNAVWEQMNKGISTKTLKSISNKPSSTVNTTTQKITSRKRSTSWMTYLGLAPKKTASPVQEKRGKHPSPIQNGTSDEARRLAAAALSAVKDAAASAAASGKGKVEITEVRDFAGQDIEVKKFVDADSKEASEKAKATVGPPSAVDTILEQIRKKQKLNVLDKTKKDWGEYKEENKGLENELDAYKKSSNQYLDKVSFLQRTDYREFERERDARLAMQSKRKTDMREDA